MLLEVFQKGFHCESSLRGESLRDDPNNGCEGDYRSDDSQYYHREPEHVIRDENKCTCIVIYVCLCVFFSPLEEI